MLSKWRGNEVQVVLPKKKNYDYPSIEYETISARASITFNRPQQQYCHTSEANRSRLFIIKPILGLINFISIIIIGPVQQPDKFTYLTKSLFH